VAKTDDKKEVLKKWSLHPWMDAVEHLAGSEGLFREFIRDGLCSYANFFAFPKNTCNFFHFSLSVNLTWMKAEVTGLCRTYTGDENMSGFPPLLYTMHKSRI